MQSEGVITVEKRFLVHVTVLVKTNKSGVVNVTVDTIDRATVHSLVVGRGTVTVSSWLRIWVTTLVHVSLNVTVISPGGATTGVIVLYTSLVRVT